MIHEEKCYVATCDNCGEIFSDGEYSMFPLESDVKDQIQSDGEWYCGDTDKEHIGKHYCPDCFKQDENIDDKIILDTSRTKPIESEPAQSPLPVQGEYILTELDKLRVEPRHHCYLEKVTLPVQEYSKEDAIDFIQWVAENRYVYIQSYQCWVDAAEGEWNGENKRLITTNQLYERYLLAN